MANIRVDLEAVAARYQTARMAGEHAEDVGAGWSEGTLNAIKRSWQDVGPLHDELKSCRKRLQKAQDTIIQLNAENIKLRQEQQKTDLRIGPVVMQVCQREHYVTDSVMLNGSKVGVQHGDGRCCAYDYTVKAYIYFDKELTDKMSGLLATYIDDAGDE